MIVNRLTCAPYNKSDKSVVMICNSDGVMILIGCHVLVWDVRLSMNVNDVLVDY